MTDRIRVECVRKTTRFDPHERISHIGGPNWALPESVAIAEIEQGKWSFYVETLLGRQVDVVIAKRSGKKYLKTTADGEQPDNLLALPNCRV